MGTGLKTYTSKIKNEWKYAFWTVMAAGLLTHIYKFTNYLIYHDSLFNVYSNQNMIGSGRWFLSIACMFSSYYDLPWLVGIGSLLFIALTAVVITELFKLKNPVLIMIISSILVTTPTVTDVFYFEYTADGYMIALLMSCLAAYLSRFEEKRWWCTAISAGLVCLTCAIYQAYVNFGLVLSMCLFIYTLFENKYSVKESFKWILRQAIIYIGGLGSYLIIWKIMLKIQNRTASDYLGISSLGQMSLSDIKAALYESAFSIYQFFFGWWGSDLKISAYMVLNVLFIVLSAVIFIYAFFKSKIYKNKISTLLLVLCTAAIPFAITMWRFASAQSKLTPRVLQGMTVLYVFFAIMFERWANVKWKNIFAVLLVILSMNFALQANVLYFLMDKSYDRTQTMATEMVVEIRQLEKENEINDYAVIGDIVEATQGQCEGRVQVLTYHYMPSLIDNMENAERYFKNVYGFEKKGASAKKVKALTKNEEVKDMPCWPASGSIKVIDGTAVIKLSD